MSEWIDVPVAEVALADDISQGPAIAKGGQFCSDCGGKIKVTR